MSPAKPIKKVKVQKLTKEGFEKLKDEIKVLKKEKAALAAKNTFIVSVMAANGLNTDNFSETSCIGYCTPKSARSVNTSTAQPSPNAAQHAKELAQKEEELNTLKGQLKSLEADHLEARLKMVRYKSERKWLAKMAQIPLSDSD